MSNGILTSDETAERVRLPKATLAYYRRAGKGPQWARIGKRIFYRESDVQAWIDAQFASTAK